MLRLSLLTIIVLLTSNLFAQRLLISSKTSVAVSYLTGSSSGEKVVDADGLKYPAFYANFSKQQGAAVQLSHTVFNVLAVDVRGSFLGLSKWESSDLLKAFDRATVGIVSANVGISVKTPFREIGLFNKLSLSAGLMPGISTLNAKLPDVINLIDHGDGLRIGVWEDSSESTFSILYHAGAQLSLSNVWAIQLRGEYHHLPIDSPLFFDTAFTYFQMNVGIVIRFNRNTKYLTNANE